MDTDTIAKVAQGVARGEYSLLLGAGASMGARGGNNVPLPSGPKLRDAFITAFSIDTGGEDITLPRAYDAAQRGNEAGVQAFLSDWFTGCEPSWQDILADFVWRRIWTLNIDDVVENVYEARGIKVDQFDWTSNHRDTRDSPHQVIHLHGFISKEPDFAGQPQNLVFSMADYAAALSDSRTWHAVFNDEFADLPFIVLGASLHEEFDLYQALKNGSGSAEFRGLPSVVVLKDVSDFHREELTSFGLVVIQDDAHNFMDALRKEAQNFTTSLEHEYGQALSPDLSRFLQQFIDLRKYEPLVGLPQHDFYSGYEPDWGNIMRDDDASFRTTGKALNRIIASTQKSEPSQQIHVLTGSPGTGKSTGLLRISQQFIARGMSPFVFREEEALDIGAAKAWLQRVPDSVLIFDNCADFADSLANLAKECEREGIDFLAVGAERTVRRRFLRDKIDQRFLTSTEEYEYRRLINEDIDSLIDKLESRGRLGKITRRTPTQKKNYFRYTASRRLFDGMADLEGGQGFRLRLQRAYQQIKDDRLKAIYAASCIAYQIGHPLSVGLASKVGNVPVKQLEPLLREGGQEALVATPQGIRPPHRITAAIVVDSALTKEDKLEAVHDLLFALAPHVDNNARRSRTRNYRLLGRLMDEETIARLVGPENGRSVYEGIQSSYDWNGRYWEQRALFESRLGNNPRARSYAERSLQISHHPFALNTLGTILGRIAIEDEDVDKLREAFKHLRAARDARNWSTSEHPYVTFFTTINRFAQAYGLALIPTTVRNEWAEWYRRARQESFFIHREGQEELRKFQVEWLRLAVA